MRRFVVMALLGCAVLLLLATSLGADEIPFIQKVKAKGTLVVGLNDSYPPFAIWTQSGPLGFDVELARYLAKSIGLNPDTQLQYKKVKPGQAADALLDGTIDIAIAALTPLPSRLQKVAFSTPYVTVTRAALLSRAKIPRVIVGERLQPMPVASYNDLFLLEPLRIGVKGGTATLQATKASFAKSTVRAYPDADQLALGFLRGEVDAVIHEDPFVRYFQNAYRSKGGRYVALTKPVTREGLCMAYKYGDPDFARYLDSLVRYLIENKTIDRWKAIYFDGTNWMEGTK